ncbi:MAG: hypothetical protein ACXVZV_15770 [Terriglobales bacterium]
MNYLDDSEYETYGLEKETLESWVTAASALMDAHCRRPSLGVAQYTERLRLNGQSTARLTYLPLAVAEGSLSSLVSLRARYAKPRRGELAGDLAFDAALSFGLSGTWTRLGVESLDWDAETGEVTLPVHPLGLPYNDVEVTYTAGLADIPGGVKCACAQIVRNAQATPALNVRGSRLDKMQMEYFSDSLLDPGVRKLLAPYVAQKVG